MMYFVETIIEIEYEAPNRLHTLMALNKFLKYFISEPQVLHKNH